MTTTIDNILHPVYSNYLSIFVHLGQGRIQLTIRCESHKIVHVIQT